MIIHHFGFSGGKDSTALVLWAVYESGIPLEQIRVTMCDTDNENEATYNQARILHQTVHPVEMLMGPLGFWDLARKKKRFPSTKARFCTQELKMKPTQAWVVDRMNEGHDVILYSGVRASESPDRAKLPAEEWDGYYATTVKRPLLKWTIAEVWAIHDRYNFPRNPLYEIGFGRVGCFPCFNANKKEIRLYAKHFPERIDYIRDKENTLMDTRGNKALHFFPKNKTPSCQCSRTVISAKGLPIQVPSIDDAVRWSNTARGGKDGVFEFYHEESFADDDKHVGCSSSLGYCE